MFIIKRTAERPGKHYVIVPKGFNIKAQSYVTTIYGIEPTKENTNRIRKAINNDVKLKVTLQYGRAGVKLSSSDLQLISDALDVLSPDSDESSDRAHELCATFKTLAEFQKSIE